MGDNLTLHEAAAFLRLSAQTLSRLIRAGKIPAARVGKRKLVIRKSDLESYMKNVAVATK